MTQQIFQLQAQFKPAGDQPSAILQLITGLKQGLPSQSLLDTGHQFLDSSWLITGGLECGM